MKFLRLLIRVRDEWAPPLGWEGDIKTSTSPCSSTDTRRRSRLQRRVEEIQPDSKNLIFYTINYLAVKLLLSSVPNAQQCSIRHEDRIHCGEPESYKLLQFAIEYQTFRIFFQLQEWSAPNCGYFFKEVIFSIHRFSRFILGNVFLRLFMDEYRPHFNRYEFHLHMNEYEDIHVQTFAMLYLYHDYPQNIRLVFTINLRLKQCNVQDSKELSRKIYLYITVSLL